MVAEMRRVTDEFDGPRVDRGNLSAARAPGRLLPAAIARRRPPAVQFPAAVHAVERASIATISADYEAALPPRLAELGARQPRPAADRQPRRPDQARVAALLLLTCAARRRSTTATRSACVSCRSRRIGCAIPLRRTCRASASDATAAARRCNGTTPPVRVFERQAVAAAGHDYTRENVATLNADAILHPRAVPGADRASKEITATGDGRLPADRGGGRCPALPTPKATAVRCWSHSISAPSRFRSRRARSALAAQSCYRLPRPARRGRPGRPRPARE